jgi:hypothetical protein
MESLARQFERGSGDASLEFEVVKRRGKAVFRMLVLSLIGFDFLCCDLARCRNFRKSRTEPHI